MRLALRIALAALPVCACTAYQEEPELREQDIITLNALSPEAFLTNGDALHALACAPLDGASTGLVGTAAGRQLLSYVVRCALGAGQTASFPRPGNSDLRFTGLIGIARSWEGAPLDASGRRFMTACLMGHVNAVGMEIPISVRSSRLGTTPLTERLLFPAQEMGVYGNFFAPASERELFVCFGQAVAQSLGGGGGLGGALGLPTYLDFRVCSVQGPECGFHRVGACYRWPSGPPVSRSACEVQSGNLYNRCHEAPIEVRPTPAWDDMVSVYLQPGDLALLLAAYVDLICELTGGQICELVDL